MNPISEPSQISPERWQLRLYVAGQTPKSLAAFTNLKKICEEHLKGKYQIEIIDLLPEVLNPDIKLYTLGYESHTSVSGSKS